MVTPATATAPSTRPCHEWRTSVARKSSVMMLAKMATVTCESRWAGMA
ncbi:MAG: hypothetical protein NTW19_13030 [Planctomycetota bacterium]|nr:hypothetical protein [Planctomycetota bacterium]